MLPRGVLGVGQSLFFGFFPRLLPLTLPILSFMSLLTSFTYRSPICNVDQHKSLLLHLWGLTPSFLLRSSQNSSIPHSLTSTPTLTPSHPPSSHVQNFALMGLSCGPTGTFVVTDNDTVEVSNLSRQLLFREEDVHKFKSDRACERVRLVNPAFNCDARQVRVGG